MLRSLPLFITLLFLAFLPLICSQSIATVPSPWSYDPASPRGPYHWGSLDPTFSPCDAGQSQSPIDLPRILPSPASPTLAIHWDDLHSSVSTSASSPTLNTTEDLHTLINNGHSILVKFDTTHSHVTYLSTHYTLAQFHFHAPSEHSIDGHFHDMELHLVHFSATGEPLVVGVFIDADPNEDAEEAQRQSQGTSDSNSASSFLKALTWTHLPSTQTSGRASHRPLLYLLQSTLSSSAGHAPAFYTYPGSLTTPPCTEGVQWFVHTTPLHISPLELDTYTRLFHHTARPVQPLHSRAITLTTTPSEHPLTPVLLTLSLFVFITVILGVWLCTRYLHRDSLEERLSASIMENVEKDKALDREWKRDRQGGEGAEGEEGGVGTRGRGSLKGGRRGGGLTVGSQKGYQEEDTAPLLSSYPTSSFPSPAPNQGGGALSQSPHTVMVRRSIGNGSRSSSSGSLSDVLKGEDKGERKGGGDDASSFR